VIGLGVSACSNLFANHASCISTLYCPSLYYAFFNSQDSDIAKAANVGVCSKAMRTERDLVKLAFDCV
jgi:hypothetical protein